MAIIELVYPEKFVGKFYSFETFVYKFLTLLLFAMGACFVIFGLVELST